MTTSFSCVSYRRALKGGRGAVNRWLQIAISQLDGDKFYTAEMIHINVFLLLSRLRAPSKQGLPLVPHNSSKSLQSNNSTLSGNVNLKFIDSQMPKLQHI